MLAPLAYELLHLSLFSPPLVVSVRSHHAGLPGFGSVMVSAYAWPPTSVIPASGPTVFTEFAQQE